MVVGLRSSSGRSSFFFILSCGSRLLGLMLLLRTPLAFYRVRERVLFFLDSHWRRREEAHENIVVQNGACRRRVHSLFGKHLCGLKRPRKQQECAFKKVCFSAQQKRSKDVAIIVRQEVFVCVHLGSAAIVQKSFVPHFSFFFCSRLLLRPQCIYSHVHFQFGDGVLLVYHQLLCCVPTMFIQKSELLWERYTPNLNSFWK